MSRVNVSGGLVGYLGAGACNAYQAGGVTIVAATFAGTTTSAPVPVSSGVTGGLTLGVSTSGAPTSAAVVLEGSTDGVNWVALPAPAASGPASVEYTFIRLRCTALAGGTSPTITATAFAVP